MNARHTSIVLFATVLAACVSHEGVYAPACMAYTGDRIELRNDRFAWERFTDSVVVDDNGNVVNQFPGYPIHGNYSLDGQAVIMKTAAGESIPSMYLHQHGERTYLLTAAEHEAVERTGEYAECALVLAGSASN